MPWRATAGHPIPFATRSIGFVRTIPASSSKASISSTGTPPSPTWVIWRSASKACLNWQRQKSKMSSCGTAKPAPRGIRISRSRGYIVPPELHDSDEGHLHREAAIGSLGDLCQLHEKMRAWYQEKLPRPDDMKPEAYKRNIAARAFDVARYCLFFGIPTGVGQVVSIRTLEKQVRRLKASVYEELRELG